VGCHWWQNAGSCLSSIEEQVFMGFFDKVGDVIGKFPQAPLEAE
jgi:hypothetical protein